MDGLKEIFETLNSRIRNPIFGSIAIAFVTINFSALFLLFWGKGDPEVRILTFSDLGYWRLLFLPIVAGVVLSFITPWVRYFSVWIAEVPVRKQKMLQDESMHKVLIEKNVLEAARNEAMELRREEILNQAKAEDALSEISNPEIRERAEDQLSFVLSENSKQLQSDTIDFLDYDTLSNEQKLILLDMARSPLGLVEVVDDFSGVTLKIFNDEDESKTIFHQMGQGDIGKFREHEILSNMVALNLIRTNKKVNNVFKITDIGLKVARKLEREAS